MALHRQVQQCTNAFLFMLSILSTMDERGSPISPSPMAFFLQVFPPSEMLPRFLFKAKREASFDAKGNVSSCFSSLGTGSSSDYTLPTPYYPEWELRRRVYNSFPLKVRDPNGEWPPVLPSIPHKPCFLLVVSICFIIAWQICSCFSSNQACLFAT